ncbi:MAG: hypothetical protein ACLURV_12105 [Gallintestinimicrobium sp.]
MGNSVELKDRVAELLTGYEPAMNGKNVIHMLHYYHPDKPQTNR